jgi:uncharacterized protein YjbI with pentapeptide repeats
MDSDKNESQRDDHDLVNADLTKENLTGRDFSGKSLEGANISGVSMANCKLVGTLMFAAKLENCQFLGADLSNADLTQCNAHQAGFGGAILKNAIFFNANLEDTTFTNSKLQGADFRTAKLNRARFREAELENADFSKADLSNCDFENCSVKGVKFNDAILSSSNLKNVKDFHEATWIGADITGVNFCGAYMLRRHIMDENYLHEYRTSSKIHAWIYKLWWLTSDCGRSFSRWALLTFSVGILFGFIYRFVGLDYGDYETALSPFYYSFVTLTTLGYGDVLPNSGLTQGLAIFEVVIGYIFLGGMMSIFANKMARRAE